MSRGGELCDDQRCQVYIGADAEYAQMNKAVADSSGQVITYGGALASAVYSANGGGHEASREEGFGQTGNDFPYLRPAPYETKDLAPWKATVALTDVASRLGYGGQVSDVRITKKGPSGRALEVTLDGSAGAKIVPGLGFAASLGFKSTLFSASIGTADVAPPAPPPSSELQALPDDAAALGRAGGTLSAGAVPRLPRGPGQRRRSKAADPALSWAAVTALLLVAGATTMLLRRRLLHSLAGGREAESGGT
jgi:stage II sporulation protein D